MSPPNLTLWEKLKRIQELEEEMISYFNRQAEKLPNYQEYLKLCKEVGTKSISFGSEAKFYEGGCDTIPQLKKNGTASSGLKWLRENNPPHPNPLVESKSKKSNNHTVRKRLSDDALAG